MPFSLGLNTVPGIDQDDSFYLAICKIKDDNGSYADWKEIPFEIGMVNDC